MRGMLRLLNLEVYPCAEGLASDCPLREYSKPLFFWSEEYFMECMHS